MAVASEAVQAAGHLVGVRRLGVQTGAASDQAPASLVVRGSDPEQPGASGYSLDETVPSAIAVQPQL